MVTQIYKATPNFGKTSSACEELEHILKPSPEPKPTPAHRPTAGQNTSPWDNDEEVHEKPPAYQDVVSGRVENRIVDSQITHLEDVEVHSSNGHINILLDIIIKFPEEGVS